MTSKVDKYKTCAITFDKTNKRVGVLIHGVHV